MITSLFALCESTDEGPVVFQSMAGARFKYLPVFLPLCSPGQLEGTTRIVDAIFRLSASAKFPVLHGTVDCLSIDEWIG